MNYWNVWSARNYKEALEILEFQAKARMLALGDPAVCDAIGQLIQDHCPEEQNPNIITRMENDSIQVVVLFSQEYLEYEDLIMEDGVEISNDAKLLYQTEIYYIDGISNVYAERSYSAVIPAEIRELLIETGNLTISYDKSESVNCTV